MSPVYSVNVKNTQKVGSEYVPHAISGTWEFRTLVAWKLPNINSGAGRKSSFKMP
jgi:hypothetical protein